MSQSIATVLVWSIQIYLSVGILFALYCLFAGGLGRIERGAAQGTRGFRLLIFPGLMALWPVLFRRALTGAGAAPTERNAHRDAAAANGKRDRSG
ncbi:MAG: hypothetical protein HKP27_16075 [Myxococcales bacterium]|nr:hypothetical protein [Myxococcales bacterium]